MAKLLWPQRAKRSELPEKRCKEFSHLRRMKRRSPELVGGEPPQLSTSTIYLLYATIRGIAHLTALQIAFRTSCHFFTCSTASLVHYFASYARLANPSSSMKQYNTEQYRATKRDNASDCTFNTIQCNIIQGGTADKT